MTSIAREALKTRSTWLGPDLLNHDDWVRRLGADQISDLENALVVAIASSRAMTDFN